MPLSSTASNTSESAFLFHSANGSGGIVDLALGPVPGAQRPIDIHVAQRSVECLSDTSVQVDT